MNDQHQAVYRLTEERMATLQKGKEKAEEELDRERHQRQKAEEELDRQRQQMEEERRQWQEILALRQLEG
jgi:FtsZ-binding cell division protein ZapB